MQRTREFTVALAAPVSALLLGVSAASAETSCRVTQTATHDVYTFTISARDAERCAESMRACTMLGNKIVNTLNDLADPQTGVKLGALVAKFIVAGQLRSGSKHFYRQEGRYVQWCLRFRRPRSRAVKATIEIFDHVAEIWKSAVGK